ncbi:MAG: polysaccharide deacetylase family protein [Actinobacteria bacterium]|nr:polysaccharide deacetylase family protein [Actinomycetota bacterium]
MNSRPYRLLVVVGVAVLLTAVTSAYRPTLVERVLGGSAHYAPTLFVSFAIIAVVAVIVSYYEYHGFGTQEGIVRRGPNAPVVAITYDDGPNPKYTPRILEILQTKEARATFFCTGLHVEKYPEIARRIVAEGHDIGSHTYSHRDLVPATRRVVEDQLRRAEAAIFSVTGVATRLFRPPRGLYSNAVRRIVVDEFGLQMILWTVSALDWRGLTPKQIVRRIARYVRPGAIILFHDSGALLRREGGKRASTVEALPLVIDYLRSAGYEIVPVSEMLDRLTDTEMEPRRALERA